MNNINILILVLLINLSITQYNTSICLSFPFNGMYYIINSQSTNKDVINNNTIHNFCTQTQYYCNYTNSVVTGQLIIIDPQTRQCYQYQQYNIKNINQSNILQGIAIQYQLVKDNNTDISIYQNITKIIQFTYQCTEDNKIGCPYVDSSIIWQYFNQNQLGYTITFEILGVIFMVLGIYIYRVTIVLLGAATNFAILVAVQAYIIFLPGFSQSFIGNVLILTTVCSGLSGYVVGYFPKVGLLFMGMWIGVIISLTLNNVAFYLIRSNPANLTLYIFLPILAILFGIIALCVRKTFVVFATSFIGAYMCLRALSWHLGAFPNQFIYSKKYQFGLEGKVPWQFYLYVIALLILTASSSALQFWLFKKKLNKTHQSGNIEDHINALEDKFKQQRQQIIQSQVSSKSSQNHTTPRILKRPQRYSIDQQSQRKQKSSQQQQNQQHSQSQEQQRAKPQLMKKLVPKRK